MFFGALTAAADTTFGVLLFPILESRKHRVTSMVKEFHAVFVKRFEGDAVFSCEDGHKLKQLIERTVESGERAEDILNIAVTVPSKFGNEVVARFEMVVSLKTSKKK